MHRHNVRTLNQLLARIARRTVRISNMREWGLDAPAAIKFEENILTDLKKQYTDRLSRLQLYMGVQI
jgi:hypothetical protein